MREKSGPTIKISPEELAELKARIEKLEAKLERKEMAKERETKIKAEIKSFIKEMSQKPSFAPPVQTRDEAKEIEKFSRPEQVGALVNLAFEKGISYAVKVAMELQNPAILDEFHDTLVDKYYQYLVEQNVIKPF